MSMEKQFICFANSKKYTERCIAGIEINQLSWQGGRLRKANIVRTADGNPKWIRPASARQSGAVSPQSVDHVSLLDIVKLKVTAPVPNGYQSENAHFDGRRMKILGSIQKSPTLFEKLLSINKWSLFGNRGKAVSVEDIPYLDHSLVLIRPTNVKAYQQTSVKGKPQIRAEFVYNDHPYDLPITDIDFIFRFRSNSTLLNSCENIYFTISLGLEFQGWHHKLIAGVIYW